MKDEYNIIRIDSIEIPMEFFDKNLRVKVKIDELFSRNDYDIMFNINKIARMSKLRDKNIEHNLLFSRFKFYFYKSVVCMAVKEAFSMRGSRHTFEWNVVKHLTDENLQEALYGSLMQDVVKSFFSNNIV